MSVERGCGKRIAGGVYAVCPVSNDGKPLEWFIFDPPRVVDTQELGVSPRGVHAKEIGGRTHVLDWVGSDSYPNVADFLEEVRRFGMSRRLPKTFDFAALQPGSRMMLLHSRAHLSNDDAYYQAMLDAEDHPELVCPKALPDHRLAGPDSIPDGSMMPVSCCAGLWWHDIAGGDSNPDGTVTRSMPAFSYTGWATPEGVKPEYKPALFASFPIAMIEVVRDNESGLHEETFVRAAAANVPTMLVDE